MRNPKVERFQNQGSKKRKVNKILFFNSFIVVQSIDLLYTSTIVKKNLLASLLVRPRVAYLA